MRLRSMAFLMLSGNAVFVLSQFLIVVIIAKLEGAAVLGSYAMAQAVVTPVFALTNMGLRPAITSDSQCEYHISTYLRLWIFTAIVGTIISVFISGFVGVNELSSILVYAIIIGRLSESLSFLCYGVFQRREEITCVSRSFILRGILALVFMLLAILITDDIVIAIYCAFIAWLFVLIIIDLPALLATGELTRPRDSSDKQDVLIRLFKKVAPLGVLALFTAMIQHSPRFIIQYLLGVSYVGYFTAISQIANIGSLLINAVGQTLLARLSKLYADNIRAHYKLLWKAMGFAALVGGCGVIVSLLFGKWMLFVIYSEDFSEYSGALVAAMAWTMALFISVTIGVGLTSARRFFIQSVITGLVLVFLLPFCWYMVSLYGIAGAFYAMSFSLLLKSVMQFYAVRASSQSAI